MRIRSGKLLAHHTPQGSPCPNREIDVSRVDNVDEDLTDEELANVARRKRAKARKLESITTAEGQAGLPEDPNAPWAKQRSATVINTEPEARWCSCGERYTPAQLASPADTSPCCSRTLLSWPEFCATRGVVGPKEALEDLRADKPRRARKDAGQRAHEAQVAQIERDRREAALQSPNTFLRGINGLDDDLPSDYEAERVDERTAKLPDGTRLRVTPPGQPTVRDLLPVGTLVKANYHGKSEKPLVVIEASEETCYGLPTWGLTLVPLGTKLNDNGDAPKSALCWINELVAQDGRILPFFEIDNDEVFIVDAKGRKTNPQEAKLANKPDSEPTSEAPTPRVLGARKRSHIAGAVLVDVDHIDLAAHYDGIPLDEAFVESLMSLASPGDLLEAADVTPKADDRFELHQGRHRLEVFRRRRAAAATDAERAAWSKLDCIVHKDLDEIQALRIAGVKNFMRRKPGLYEQARYFDRLVRAGAKVVDVARDAGLSEQTARNRLKLLKLPADLAQRVGRPDEWLTSSHAEIAVPAIDAFGEPAVAALRAAVQEGDVGDWNRPVERFRAIFAGNLRAKKLIEEIGTHEETQARRYPDLAAALDALPKIQLGQLKYARGYYADAPGFYKVIEQWMAYEDKARAPAAQQASRAKDAASASRSKDAAAATKPAAPPMPRGKSVETIVDEKIEELRATAIATGIRQASPTIRRMVMAHTSLWLADQGDLHPADEPLLARVSGLELRDVAVLRARSGAAYFTTLERLAKAKDQRLETFAAAAAALSMEREMWLPPQIMERFCTFDEKEARKKLMRDELAAKKEHKTMAELNASAVKASDRLARGPAKKPTAAKKPAARPKLTKKKGPNRAGVAAAMARLGGGR